MVVLNSGKATELTLRVVIESVDCGREFFDDYDNTTEIIEAVGRLVKSACLEAAKDGIERTVAVAIVPKSQYGDEDGYGFGLGTDSDDVDSDDNP
jgi:hypothetical protein